MQKQLDERILCTLQSDMVALARENTWKQLKYAQNIQQPVTYATYSG